MGSIVGTVVSKDDIVQAAKARLDDLLRMRRLPIIFDIDATIVEAVGTQSNNFPAHQLPLVPLDRYFEITYDAPYGKQTQRLVIATGLFEFLSDLSRDYLIHIYTHGDEFYCEAIKVFLNGGKKLLIRGEAFSGCHTLKKLAYYDALKTSDGTKWSQNLVAFGRAVGTYPLDAIIIDDMPKVWCSADQQRILPALPLTCRSQKEMKNTEGPIWDVPLTKFLPVLRQTHTAFFKQYDSFRTSKGQIPFPDIAFHFQIALRDGFSNAVSQIDGPVEKDGGDATKEDRLKSELAKLLLRAAEVKKELDSLQEK
ncbi:hypothetical protein HDV00_007022 [Rhizophlyctis rosea]|nr:hypothetical protein HDV00_007022 [Rhizophlyctis rosea]